MLISVWFSCGAASAVAAKLTLEKFGKEHEVRIINNPVVNEHPDNVRFLKDVEKWLGTPIEFAKSSKFPSQDCNDVWKSARFMNSPHGAKCTTELKRVARQEWEKNNVKDWQTYYIVMGFTKEEQKRHENFTLTERSNVIPVLIDAGFSKQGCIDYLHNQGLNLPEMYSLGFPNANCIGCVKASSPTYWNHVRLHFPDVYEERAKLSREIGCRLVRYKGKRIFLDELPLEAKGRPIKSLKMPDCSIFCEEKF